MNERRHMKISAYCMLSCLYFLLLPTTIAVNSAGNSFLKLAAVPIAAYFVIALVFSKQVLQFNWAHLLLALYTVSTLITLFVDPAYIKTVLGYFLNAALYLCLTVIPYNKRELRWLENAQVLLLCMVVAVTLFSGGSAFDRTTLVIFGQAVDPNYFVGFLIFPLSVTLGKIMRSKYRIAYILLAALSIYCVFLSGSRGGLLAIVATIVAFALIYPDKVKTKLLFCFGGCAFLMFAWFVAAPLLPGNILARLSVENVIETGGTGRWYIWKSMLAEIVNSPDKLWFGRGFYGMHQVFLGGRWSLAVAHNQLLQVLYDQGVVGVMAFMALAVGCLLRCIKRRKTVAVAIIGMLALSISLSFNPTTRTFWNLIAYAALNFPEESNCIPTENNRLPEEDQS